MNGPILSRRSLLGQGCAAICACHLPMAFPSIADANSPHPKPLSTFAYDRVRLGNGPLRDQFDHQQKLFLGIDDDKLLKPFRKRAGLDAPGADMGGWYDETPDFHVDPNDWGGANWHGFIPGHSFGQYVSGLARGYAANGNEDTRRKVASLIHGWIPTISPTFFDDYNLPAYTYDKLVIGLIDAYQFARVAEAKDALAKLTDAALPFLPEKALTREERRARPYKREAQIWDEPYTLPENLFLAWQRGFGERYRDLALRYVADESLFDPLSRGVSPFRGKHAYSHVNALSSAMQAFHNTGNTKYLDAARNGFDFILAQSYATGGWGPNEELLAADDRTTLFDMLSSTHRSFETPCGTYGHFKIARYLLAQTGDSRYGDSMERVLYNTVLGALPTLPDGSTFYYSDYNGDATKFYRAGEPWPCCSGTFVQLAADYGISAWLHDDRSLYVNLFVPSTVLVSFGRGFAGVIQETDYPLGNTVRLRFDAPLPIAFELRPRIPAWAGPATRIRINGRDARTAIRPGSFARLARTWKLGDVVEIELDMGLRLESLDTAHPDVAALMTGPLVLFPISAPNAPLRREDLLAAERTGPREWRMKAGGQAIALKPFMAIGTEHYRLYNELSKA